jgi:hypothetical protein
MKPGRASYSNYYIRIARNARVPICAIGGRCPESEVSRAIAGDRGSRRGVAGLRFEPFPRFILPAAPRQTYSPAMANGELLEPTAAPPSRRRLPPGVLVVLAAPLVIVGGGLLVRRLVYPRRAMLAPDVVAKQPIVPGRALGPVALGMTGEQVTAAIGKPDSIHGPRNWQYRHPDIAVSFGKDIPPTVGAIFAGGAPQLTDVPYRTAEGFGIGSPVSDVKAAWGPAEKESGESTRYLSRGITLMHKDGKVVWLCVRTFRTDPDVQSTTGREDK